MTGFDPDIYRLLGRRLAASRQASNSVAGGTTGTLYAAAGEAVPAPARRPAAPLVVLPLSRPAFRLSPSEPADAAPGKPTMALLRRRQPRPEDPAQFRLPFDAH